MEDYKERYEQALERAKNYHEGHTLDVNPKTAMEYVFPELKESEDGRMIKSLKRLIKAYYNVNFPTPEGFEREDMISWLEKQTIDISSFPEEQRKYMEKYVNLDKTTLVKLLAERDENIEESLKASLCDECEHPTLNCGNFPCDKVTKPKFKIGDKITNGENIYTINNIVKDCYFVKEHDCVEIPFEYQDKWNLVEPKFRIGDFVKNTNYHGEPIYEIVYIDKECYICEYRGKENMGDKAVMHFSFDNPYLRFVQKPAWNEEDEKILHEISQCVYDNVVNIGTVNKVRYIDWLKSIKERIKEK